MQLMCRRTVVFDRECPAECFAFIEEEAITSLKCEVGIMVECGGKDIGEVASYLNDSLEYPESKYLTLRQNIEADFLTLVRARRKGIKVERTTGIVCYTYK